MLVYRGKRFFIYEKFLSIILNLVVFFIRKGECIGYVKYINDFYVLKVFFKKFKMYLYCLKDMKFIELLSIVKCY